MGAVAGVESGVGVKDKVWGVARGALPLEMESGGGGVNRR